MKAIERWIDLRHRSGIQCFLVAIESMRARSKNVVPVFSSVASGTEPSKRRPTRRSPQVTSTINIDCEVAAP
jgi:hypothetical protein